MAHTDSPAQYHPAFWLRPALLLPLAIGGLCLAGFAFIAWVLQILTFETFLPGMFWGWQLFFAIVGIPVWLFSVWAIAMVAARLIVRRIEGQVAGIYTDPSLLKAMTRDHTIWFWLLFAQVIATFGISKVQVFFSTTQLFQNDNSGWSLIYVIAGFGPMLRLVGLAIKHTRPDLWPEIQARAGRKLSRPSWKMLALLIFVFAFFVIWPSIPSIWSALQ